MYVIGIDPGPVVGVIRLQLEIRPGRQAALLDAEALQATPGVLEPALDSLLQDDEAVVAVERFVVGPRAARSSTPAAGAAAREIACLVTDWATRRGHQYWARSAADVKPWATDERLEAAGLLDFTAGMRHARDAARHALFCAVRNYGLPDPLSKAGTR